MLLELLEDLGILKKWLIPGLLENFANLFTANAISGLVHHDIYTKTPITDL